MSTELHERKHDRPDRKQIENSLLFVLKCQSGRKVRSFETLMWVVGEFLELPEEVRKGVWKDRGTDTEWSLETEMETTIRELEQYGYVEDMDNGYVKDMGIRDPRRIIALTPLGSKEAECIVQRTIPVDLFVVERVEKIWRTTELRIPKFEPVKFGPEKVEPEMRPAPKVEAEVKPAPELEPEKVETKVTRGQSVSRGCGISM